MLSKVVASLKTATLTGFIAFSLAGSVYPAHAKEKISSIDTNKDGSITMEEAHAAAEKKFDRLDKTHGGKLEVSQLSPAEKAMKEMARHKKEQSIDKSDYMAGVDAAFKEADPKGSGVLNAAALKTNAGRHFLSLVE